MSEDQKTYLRKFLADLIKANPNQSYDVVLSTNGVLKGPVECDPDADWITVKVRGRSIYVPWLHVVSVHESSSR